MNDVVKTIQAGLEREPAVNVHQDDIRVVTGEEGIRLEGAVSTIAAKRRALQVAVQAAGGEAVHDHLQLRPDAQVGDDHLTATLDQVLRGDRDFQGIAIGRDEAPQSEPQGAWMVLSAHDGVVRLQGVVPSVNHRQLAEVMAWWIPGTTGVVNELQVDPPQEDDDGEILDALNLVLDRDPALQHDEIQLMVREGEVTMGGVAVSAEQRERAERNCWYLPGVRNVINKLDIAP